MAYSFSGGLLHRYSESIRGFGRELFSSTCPIELNSSLVLHFWSSLYAESVLGSSRESFSSISKIELAV